MSAPSNGPPRRIQRQIDTLGHALTRLFEAVGVLQRRVARANVGDEALRLWLGPWLAAISSAPFDHAAPTLLWWAEDSLRLITTDGAGDASTWAIALMLFHLPALRPFWRTALRASRLRRLQRILPRAWPLDPTPVPPGATLSGLGLDNWAALDVKLSEGRVFEAIAIDGTAERILLDSVKADALPGLLSEITRRPWVLLETPARNVEAAAEELTVTWHRNDAGRLVLNG